MRGIKDYFLILESALIFSGKRKCRLNFFVIRELNVLAFLMNCEKYLIFYVNCDTSVILLLTSNVGNSNKTCNSHSTADASNTYTHVGTPPHTHVHHIKSDSLMTCVGLCSIHWGAILWTTTENNFYRVYQKFGLSVFFSKWQSGVSTLK